jgi:hypothetical protein
VRQIEDRYLKRTLNGVESTLYIAIQMFDGLGLEKTMGQQGRRSQSQESGWQLFFFFLLPIGVS